MRAIKKHDLISNVFIQKFFKDQTAMHLGRGDPVFADHLVLVVGPNVILVAVVRRAVRLRPARLDILFWHRLASSQYMGADTGPGYQSLLLRVVC